jgi:hypothetical protein
LAVAAIANDHTMETIMGSIFELLRADHQRLRRALIRLRAVAPHTDPREPLQALLRLYTAHARAEEQVFYSYLIHVRSAQQRALQGLQEHARLDVLLREAEHLPRDAARWTPVVGALCEAMHDHLHEVETGLFSLARGALSGREASELGARYLDEYSRLCRDLGVLEVAERRWTAALAVGGARR